MQFDLWYYDSSASQWEDYSWHGVEHAYPVLGWGSYWYDPDPTSGWVPRNRDLTSEVANVNGVRLHFGAWDDSTDHVVEMGVDNVLVEADRQECAALGIALAPNDIGDSLRAARSGNDVDLSWTAPTVDGAHDAAAYYEMYSSAAPDAGFGLSDTTTATFLTRTPPGSVEYYEVRAVNTAGASSDWPPAFCGDGTRESEEACDGADLGGDSCVSQGFDGGHLQCNSICDGFDTTSCTICGDDLHEGTEVCDGSDVAGETCVSQGWVGGTLGCLPGCEAFDTSGCAGCGNEMLETGEVCDGANLAGETCGTQGFDDGALACASDCSTFDTSGCWICGDDTQNPGEVCDGLDLIAETCLTQGFDGGTLACAPACDAFDTSACTTCGNDAQEPGEVCDGVDLAGETCQSQGFDAGTLACSGGCDGYDTSGCRFFECGNTICEPAAGEDCLSCAADCNGVQSGNPGSRYCCGDGDGDTPVDCSDSRCTAGGNTCEP
jgi:hypothetical protein